MNESEAIAEADKRNREITAAFIKERLDRRRNFYNVYIDEYTHGGLRIDGISVNTRERTIKGYEVKVSRSDFKQDKKWHLYGEFCSSLSIVCPPNLIQPGEIDRPFGLIWIGYKARKTGYLDFGEWDVVETFEYKKRPKELADVNMYNWLFTYMRVLEFEFPRLVGEVADLRCALREKR